MPAAERILVFGDVIDDIIVVPSGPIRVDTDTPSAIRSRAGGSAANTAAWLAEAGADVAFVGRCATTDVERHTTLLATGGVDARFIGDDERPTGTIIVIVDGDVRSMLTERGANAAHSPADIDPRGFGLVHTTGYNLVGFADEFAALVDRAHAAGARVSLNAGAVAAIDDVGREAFLTATAGVDILIASAAEATLLTGEENPDAAAAALAQRHGLVAVTAGRDGAWVAAGATAAAHVSAVGAQAVDPTGAGDAFAAGFLAGLMSGVAPAEAARGGAALAARAVTVPGARPVA